MKAESHINKLQVRQHFSSHASEYDRYAIVQHKVACRLSNMLAEYLRPAQKALEVGCGTGLLSRQLLRLLPALRLVLSDLAHGMSQYVHQTLSGAPVCDADAAALPFLKDSFDLVASSSVYQWLNDFPNAFEQVAGVLRPGGLFAVALFGEKTLFELRASHQAALPHDQQSHVQSFPSLGTISDAIGVGFEVLSLKSDFEVEWHPDVQGLLRSLKKIGAQNASQQRPHGLASRKVMQAMISHYNDHYGRQDGIPATYEVIYLLARLR